MRTIGAVLFAVVVVLVAPVLPAGAAQAPVGLGTATSFAILAGSGITNTGATTVTGDIGSHPTTTQSGFGSVTQDGANHAGDSVTQGAKSDLVTAYNDAAGRNPRTAQAVELGGLTLLPGVYASPTFGLTGTLTLDAVGDPEAMFVFQAESTLIAEVNSAVELIGSADPCHVVWQVGSSATFKTGTRFVGDVLALTSITAQTNATFRGRLLARDGAVTLDTNTITNSACATSVGGGGSTTTTTSTTPTGATTTTTPTTTTTAAAAAASTVTVPPSAGSAQTATTGGSSTTGVTTGTATGVPRGGTTNGLPELPVTGFPLGAWGVLGLFLVAAGSWTVWCSRSDQAG
jgi:hypothetical protein